MKTPKNRMQAQAQVQAQKQEEGSWLLLQHSMDRLRRQDLS
jgi:hypothetical protein